MSRDEFLRNQGDSGLFSPGELVAQIAAVEGLSELTWPDEPPAPPQGAGEAGPELAPADPGPIRLRSA